MNAEVASTRRWLLWVCLWGGGAAWLLHFIAIWICAEFGCISGLGRPGPLGISLVAWLVLAFTGIFIMLGNLALYNSWRLCHHKHALERFVARCGLVLNAMFLLIIAVQSVPVFFYLKSCGSAMG
jgi:hypothetical protein